MRIRKVSKNITKNFMQKEIEKFNKDSNFLKQELEIIGKLHDAVARAADDWYNLEQKRDGSYDPYSFYAVMLDIVYTQAMKENLVETKKNVTPDFYSRMDYLFKSISLGKNPYWKSKNLKECNG